ncbi:MAG: hypothetical protein ACTSRG_07690 [Candidatus Helarchaeota archaeon]
MTLFSLINEILEAEVYAHEIKLGKTSKIIPIFQNLMIAKDIGMSFVPFKLLNLVHKHAFTTEAKDEILQEWYNYGKWLANYSKIRFPKKELQIIENVSKNIFWQSTDFQVIKKPNEKNPKEIEIRLFGQQLEMEYLVCISKVYEGIFHQFNFKTVIKNISDGIAHLKFAVE